MSRARVSVEEAPVEILAPDDSVFHYPNHITQRDFEGWVQERGLYFMDQWDSNFRPLLSSHDPGEPPLKGGLLRAQYGKGTYIFAAYAFFRQLPAGVPGAIRLYVNLLGAGHEKRSLAGVVRRSDIVVGLRIVLAHWPLVVGALSLRIVIGSHSQTASAINQTRIVRTQPMANANDQRPTANDGFADDRRLTTATLPLSSAASA